PLSAGLIYVHQKVSNKFKSQLRDFDPSTRNQKDDFIDSVASAIHELPCHIPLNGEQSGAGQIINDWQQGSGEEIQYEFTSSFD
ncbi:MAG: hypothetical protein OEZ38_12305, partial [Gammaproteobacteria bacterium]|nr:hypothetical protein [Gammaproteobacteria bacterium]